MGGAHTKHTRGLKYARCRRTIPRGLEQAFNKVEEELYGQRHTQKKAELYEVESD